MDQPSKKLFRSKHEAVASTPNRMPPRILLSVCRRVGMPLRSRSSMSALPSQNFAVETVLLANVILDNSF
jgi:hypothetical protein